MLSALAAEATITVLRAWITGPGRAGVRRPDDPRRHYARGRYGCRPRRRTGQRRRGRPVSTRYARAAVSAQLGACGPDPAAQCFRLTVDWTNGLTEDVFAAALPACTAVNGSAGPAGTMCTRLAVLGPRRDGT